MSAEVQGHRARKRFGQNFLRDPNIIRRIVAAIDPKYLTPRNIRQEVDYWTDAPPGSIVVDPWLRFLYLIQPGNRALRYGVAVGDEGSEDICPAWVWALACSSCA